MKLTMLQSYSDSGAADSNLTMLQSYIDSGAAG